jgi:IS5 family transposase
MGSPGRPDSTAYNRPKCCSQAAQRERVKAQIRAKVEHPFHVVKNLFRHRKVRYRGLLKNTAQLFTLFGLANLVMARRLTPSACS